MINESAKNNYIQHVFIAYYYHIFNICIILYLFIIFNHMVQELLIIDFYLFQ